LVDETTQKGYLASLLGLKASTSSLLLSNPI
jgi:hypothetical protein